MVVDCLIMLKGEMQWSKSTVPSWFLPLAAEWMKDKADVIFSELELKDRVDLLRKRYYTFKVVLRIRGACLDAPTKAIVAPADSWEKMLKMNAFAGAYFYQQEPICARLACVFGLDDVEVEGQTTVVVISDNTEVIHSDSIKINDVVEGEEEVNSPVVFPGPKVHRKLFDEDAELLILSPLPRTETAS
ncbi:uncharacterized protein LOC125186324 [Salvia hispanica]|uniref:uncharacterized protein LOC125186324 n=1 Tax=Salvia hispanica TaxID=49212 RepID=UPI0020098F58|nr:uncharacterized protein LOC125186324 [Salvia hispanica]